MSSKATIACLVILELGAMSLPAAARNRHRIPHLPQVRAAMNVPRTANLPQISTVSIPSSAQAFFARAKARS